MKRVDVEKITRLVIDEQKFLISFRLSKINVRIEEVHSEHNEILCSINWKMKDERKNAQKRVMTKKGCQEFTRKIEDDKVSNIWKKDGQLQDIYDEWNETVIHMKSKCVTTSRKKHISKTVRKLITRRRN